MRVWYGLGLGVKGGMRVWYPKLEAEIKVQVLRLVQDLCQLQTRRGKHTRIVRVRVNADARK